MECKNRTNTKRGEGDARKKPNEIGTLPLFTFEGYPYCWPNCWKRCSPDRWSSCRRWWCYGLRTDDRTCWPVPRRTSASLASTCLSACLSPCPTFRRIGRRRFSGCRRWRLQSNMAEGNWKYELPNLEQSCHSKENLKIICLFTLIYHDKRRFRAPICIHPHTSYYLSLFLLFNDDEYEKRWIFTTNISQNN